MKFEDILNDIKDGDYFNSVNLHIHSNFSDGVEDFDKLIEQAKELGLKYISITDHNTVEGYYHTKYKDDPILIHGVEFDCIKGLCPIHILGYGIDIKNKELLKLCSNTQNDFIRLLKSRNPQKVIEAIHNAGGKAVLAHPCCYNTLFLEKFIKKLQKMGLDGVEVFYPYDRFRKVVKFHSRKTPFIIAKKLNLIKTGGSDCHLSLVK